MHIYIPATAFANRPTKKTWRELRAAFPQVHSRSESLDASFPDPESAGEMHEPGVILITDNDPEPDAAAIRALVTSHDGSKDPPLVGLTLPAVPTWADLPAQPPDRPGDSVQLVIVLDPLGIHLYVNGRWSEV